MANYWIGVISLAHTQIGVDGGFCQFNHGKRAPLDRMTAGDRFAIYSPKTEMRGGDPIQSFTAIGEIRDRAVYQVAHAPDFHPFRRDAYYFKARHAPIRPLLPALSFTKELGTGWGQILRWGFFIIEEPDFMMIAKAMGLEREQ